MDIINKGKCEFCHNLDPGIDIETDPSSAASYICGVTTDLRKVQSRSSEGCRSCAILEQALTVLKADWRDTGDGQCFANHFWEYGKCDCYKFRLVPIHQTIVLIYPCKGVHVDKAGCNGNALELYVSNGRPLSCEELDIHSGKRGTSLSVRLQHARSWIDECRMGHRCEEPLELSSKCEEDTIEDMTLEDISAAPEAPPHLQQQLITSGKLRQFPRRILDLQDFAEKNKLRLIDGSHRTGAYACLSYCWGTQNPCRTTTATIERFLVDISWEILPQTYKDAVLVVSALKIRYLWIDALCIIQDDSGHRDWEEQSAQMGDIYGNSIVTIAAANSSSVSEGFLKIMGPVTEPLVFRAPPLPLPCSSDSPFTVSARHMLDHIWLVPDRWSAKDKIAAKPLWSRGWCFQEEFLSPRVLSFYGDEMIFQCREGYHCECGLRHRDLPDSITLHSIKSVILQPFYNRFSPYTANALWLSIIDNYGRRKLTFITDRLPALSGVARVVQGLFGTRYLAGHWDDDSLLFSLCWAALDDTPVPRFLRYVAPSWSWAALPTGLTRNDPLYDDYTLVKGTAVLAAETVLATDDPTGAILGGYLVIRGVFLDVEVVETDDGHAMRRNGVDINFSIDQESLPSDSAVGLPRVACWFVCFRYFEGKYRCSRLNVLQVIQDHPRRVCERIGYAELWCNTTDRQMQFFKGYKSCLGGAAFI